MKSTQFDIRPPPNVLCKVALVPDRQSEFVPTESNIQAELRHCTNVGSGMKQTKTENSIFGLLQQFLFLARFPSWVEAACCSPVECEVIYCVLFAYAYLFGNERIRKIFQNRYLSYKDRLALSHSIGIRCFGTELTVSRLQQHFNFGLVLPLSFLSNFQLSLNYEF